jgi:hypothetical protein
MTATTSGRVTEINLVHDAGTIVFEGQRLPVLAYVETPADGLGFDQFNLLAVAPDRWVVLFVYCSSDTLTTIWSQATDGTELDAQDASGACRIDHRSTSASVDFPAFAFQPATSSLRPQIRGTRIGLGGGGAGWLALAGGRRTLIPVGFVDCSTDCVQMPGWYELHSVLWDPVERKAGFGILYFFLDRPQEASLYFVIDLPDLTDPTGGTLTLAGGWTAPALLNGG